MYSLDQEKLENKLYTHTDVSNHKVLLRTCLNVATDKEGNMIDSTRYDESFPLIQQLASKAKTLLITAHLGRPAPALAGPKHNETQFSFFKIAQKLANDLGKRVHFVTDTQDLTQILDWIYFLENVRFFPGEESKDEQERESFAKMLTTPCDMFINDAFADYRASASTYDVAKYLPSYVGPVFAKEIKELDNLRSPERPFLAILGWAKLSEKLDSLLALLQTADKVIIGGAMRYTLLKAKGIAIGNSLVENDKLEVAQTILEKYADKILIPADHMIVQTFKDPAIGGFFYTDGQQISYGFEAIDIGPKGIAECKDLIVNAKTIVRNGPMGVFERPTSAHGTQEIGKAIMHNVSAYKLVGGGDSITAIHKLWLTGFDHICTGGGAMLAYLAYDTFPTLDIILGK